MPNPFQKIMKGLYQVQPNLFLTCYLNIVEMRSEFIKARVGKRVYGDTVFPAGTRIKIDTSWQTKEGASLKNTYDELFIEVQKTEKIHDQVVHVFTPVFKEVKTKLRKRERLNTNFMVHLETFDQFTFIVKNGTIEGLGAHFYSPRMLSGLVVGREYQLTTTYKDTPVKSAVKLIHMSYDWYTQDHSIGLQLLNLEPTDMVMIARLIDPNYPLDHLDVETSSSIDITAGEAKIKLEDETSEH